MGLYVETRIQAGLDELWTRTQTPEDHARWDLRFSEIAYLPGGGRFRYATRVAGLTIAGVGVAAGERRRPDGTRTSALRFASADPRSLIADGRGYWRYVPDGDAVRFLTGYDYRPRWGRFGVAVDRLAFRPLMGWATAWSFDRLRLWLERGIRPEVALRRWLAELAVRTALLAASALGAVVPATAVLDAGAPAGQMLAVLAGLAALAGLAVLLVPPLPGTPAARRCLRTPPAHTRAPRLLTTVEEPA